jgi:mono/diheme cytochrome c family protein
MWWARIIAVAAVALMALPAAAQESGDRLAGHDPGQQRQGTDAVPTFAAIAAMKSTTAMSLTAFLSTSHTPMPDYSLSRDDIANVSAYILSLRKK